jgi:hypothetical protein
MSRLDNLGRARGLVATRALLVASAVAPLLPLSAQTTDSLPHVTLNGYFTQAAAVSRGGLVEGIPTNGTVDYRRAALVARFFPSLSDRFVAQVAHHREGASPVARVQPTVELAWLFYERSLGSATQLRVGRAPIPMGIHNETRYVGTLLPFYEPPATVYRNRQFSNERVDGVVAIHELFGESRTPVEIAAYGGSMDYVEAFQIPAAPSAERPLGGWDYSAKRAHAHGVVGAHAWVSTPLTGLRVGGGVVHTTMTGGLRDAGVRDPVTAWSASVDGAFDALTVRAEALGADLDVARGRMGYVQVGRAFGPLTLNAQTEFGRLLLRNIPVPPTFAPQTLVTPSRDVAASAVWSFHSALQLKVEAHRTRGYNLEEGIDLSGPARRGGYFIAGLSTAF